MAFLPLSLCRNSSKLVFHPSPNLSYNSGVATSFASVHFAVNSTAKKNGVRAIMQSSGTQQPATSRPLANFSPDIWGDYFTSISINNSKMESYSTQTDMLKEKVARMFSDLTSDPMDTIRLIYLLFRLGVSYHFETEIEERLGQIFYSQPELLSEQDYDLDSTAVAFQVFRMHGYKMPSGIFNKFKDNNNNRFKESLLGDIRGLINLYEASFLSFHGEDILDEALAFAKPHLEMLATDQSSPICPHVRTYILNALKRPMQQSMVRMEARKYINFYEQEESRNETLLKFAKIDYNRVQILHQQELSELSKWRKEITMATNLSFTRKRVVESYFVALGCHFEPEYRHSRIMHAKIVILATYVDDLCDAYGTYQEAKLLVEAIQRWDDDSLAQLPDFLKPLYQALLDTFREFEKEAITKDRSFSVQYAREGLKELAWGYLQEWKWMKDGYVHVPSVEEYFGIGVLTAGIPMLGGASLMGMGEIAGVKEFQWLFSKPKFCRAAGLICRVLNDIVDHKFEQERRHIASSVECYMKEYGVSEEKAVEELKKMLVNAWKDANEDLMRKSDVPFKLLNMMLNTCRMLEVAHMNNVYGYTHPKSLKDVNEELLMKEIPI